MYSSIVALCAYVLLTYPSTLSEEIVQKFPNINGIVLFDEGRFYTQYEARKEPFTDR